MKYLLSLALVLLAHRALQAQDPQFSHINMPSMYLNPAYTAHGFNGGVWRGIVKHRTQWYNLNNGDFKTDYVSVEGLIVPGFNRSPNTIPKGVNVYSGKEYGKIPNKNYRHSKKEALTVFGVGGYVLNDNSGDMQYLDFKNWKVQTTRVALSGSAIRKMGTTKHPNLIIGGIGLEAGWTQRKLKTTDLLFYDQINDYGGIKGPSAEQLDAMYNKSFFNIGIGTFFRFDILHKEHPPKNKPIDPNETFDPEAEKKEQVRRFNKFLKQEEEVYTFRRGKKIIKKVYNKNKVTFIQPGFSITNIGISRRDFLNNQRVQRLRYMFECTAVHRWTSEKNNRDYFNRTLMASVYWRAQDDSTLADGYGQYFDAILQGYAGPVGGGFGAHYIPLRGFDSYSVYAAFNVPIKPIKLVPKKLRNNDPSNNIPLGFELWVTGAYDFSAGPKSQRINDSFEIGIVIVPSKDQPCPGYATDAKQLASRYRYPF